MSSSGGGIAPSESFSFNFPRKTNDIKKKTVTCSDIDALNSIWISKGVKGIVDVA